jgi:hypothetical protein
MMNCQPSSRCCEARKIDESMEIVDMIVNDKENWLVSKREKKKEEENPRSMSLLPY